MTTHSLRIAAPPRAVFDYLADPSRRPEWQASLRAVELLDHGEIGVGTRWVDHTVVGARPLLRIVEMRAPDEPSAPDALHRPSAPDAPHRPGAPDAPDEPDGPDAPRRPSGPDSLDGPDAPAAPGGPALPGGPAVPGDPAVPGGPTIPAAPGGPGHPGVWSEVGEWHGLRADLTLCFDTLDTLDTLDPFDHAGTRGTLLTWSVALHGSAGWGPLRLVLGALAPAAVRSDLRRAARILESG